MGRLILVRHARTQIDPKRPSSEWNLDPAGEADLNDMAKAPCFQGAYRIISSSEPKALRTAEPIRRAHGLPEIEPFDDLRELHKGAFATNHDELMQNVFQYPDASAAEGWEPAARALERVRACLGRVTKEAAGRDLIVVSHGILLSLYVAYLAGQDRVCMDDWAAVGMPDLAVVDMHAMRLIQPFGAWRREQ